MKLKELLEAMNNPIIKKANYNGDRLMLELPMNGTVVRFIGTKGTKALSKEEALNTLYVHKNSGDQIPATEAPYFLSPKQGMVFEEWN